MSMHYTDPQVRPYMELDKRFSQQRMAVVSFTTWGFQSRWIFILFPPVAAVSGAEDVALYVGMVAVALCLTLLLIVVVLVYRRKKEGLDADVADSSILTTGFQPMGIKPSKPGVWAPRPRRPPPHSSRTLFFVLPSSVRPSVLRLPTVTVQHSSTCTTDPAFVCGCGGGVSVFTVVCSLSKMYYVVCLCVCVRCTSCLFACLTHYVSPPPHCQEMYPLCLLPVWSLWGLPASNRNTTVWVGWRWGTGLQCLWFTMEKKKNHFYILGAKLHLSSVWNWLCGC